MKRKIRLNSTTSVNSVNVDNFVDVELKQSTKLLPHTNTVDKVNIYEVFEEERSKSDKYRLIFTINPICTNVLFNTLTEVVKFEGEGKKTDKVVLVENDSSISVSNAMGDVNPDRVQMIKNTEYSNDKLGYVYHCGYDIFNNHILRNTTFKQVNTLRSNNKNQSDSNQTGTPLLSKIFNTIGDVMRYGDGDIVKFNKRVNVSSAPRPNLNKHLYEYSDILSITDSINQNLIEEKGWFGFTNGMNINSKLYTGSNNNIWGDSLNINKVINRQKACEFIDMYPDRSLFSFNPKVNKKEKRLEHNWKMCLTYPYDTTYNHLLVYGDGVNGLDCYSCVRTSGLSGEDVLVFRTTCKHGLKATDNIVLYATYEGETTRIPDAITIKDTGDLNKKYRENYFYVLNHDILNHIFGDDWEFNFNQDELNRINFRIKHIIGDFESEYYIRLFKKLPNFKYSKKEFTEEIGSNRKMFDEFVKENATYCNKSVIGNCPDDNLYMLDFNYDLYQLAFASTIYSDKSSQVTFTDTIDLSHIKDKSGKPITEIYLTIVKNNSGWDKWYLGDNQRNENSVEFSHCFGKITSGFNLLNIKRDKSSSIKNKDDIRFSDVHKLHNLASSYPIVSSMPLEDNITISGSTKWYSGKAEHDVFWGDLVEFNKSQVKEMVLEKVCHRFNTTQRELDENYFTSNGVNPNILKKWNTLKFDEITADDYDKANFTVSTTNITDYNGLYVNQRPEGYYYEPHYPIMVKELSSQIQQDALITFTVSENGINPDNYSNNPGYAKVKVNVKHNLSEGDYIRVTNRSDKSYSLGIIENILSPTEFLINYPKIYNFQTFKENVENGSLLLIKTNSKIPSYATNLNDGSQRYLWREVQRVGDVNNTTLPEYPFTNGCFYIHNNINFYLRRQDPHNYNNLYYSNFPNDIPGKIESGNDDYEYINEDEVLC